MSVSPNTVCENFWKVVVKRILLNYQCENVPKVCALQICQRIRLTIFVLAKLKSIFIQWFRTNNCRIDKQNNNNWNEFFYSKIKCHLIFCKHNHKDSLHLWEEFRPILRPCWFFVEGVFGNSSIVNSFVVTLWSPLLQLSKEKYVTCFNKILLCSSRIR